MTPLIKTNQLIQEPQFIPYSAKFRGNILGFYTTIITSNDEAIVFKNYLRNCSESLKSPTLEIEKFSSLSNTQESSPLSTSTIQISDYVLSIISRIRLLNTDFEVSHTNENQITFNLKVESCEKLDGGLEKIKYKNGVIDIMQPGQLYWSKYGRRIYPNGNVYKGTFETETNQFRKQDGYSIENGVCTYHQPKFLAKNYIRSDTNLGFAQVEFNPTSISEGELRLVLLMRTSDYSDDYVVANISPEEGLYRCLHQIFEVLNHPQAPFTIERFLDYLHESDAVDHIPKILKLQPYALQKLVDEAATKKLYIDFNLRNPKMQETLFSLLVGQGNAKITQYMLELDSRYIYNRDSNGYTALEKAIMEGHGKEAAVISQFMVQNDISFSFREHWYWKAWSDEVNFNEDGLRNLSVEMQTELFKIANIYNSEKFLKSIIQVVPLIEHKPFLFQKPLIIARDMNALQIRETLNQFFERLKKEERILTQEAFKKLDRNAFVCKNNDIERLLGCHFILEAIEKTRATRIKVPRKILVHDFVGTSNYVTIKVNSGRLLTYDFLVYADKITASSRSITRQEMKELVDVLEYICFNDFSFDNIFIAEDGIYFIDTEMSSFCTKPKYQQISELSYLLYRDGTRAEDSESVIQDVAWFQNLMSEKIAKAEEKSLNSEKISIDKNYLELFPCYHLQREFKFHV